MFVKRFSSSEHPEHLIFTFLLFRASSSAPPTTTIAEEAWTRTQVPGGLTWKTSRTRAFPSTTSYNCPETRCGWVQALCIGCKRWWVGDLEVSRKNVVLTVSERGVVLTVSKQGVVLTVSERGVVLIVSKQGVVLTVSKRGVVLTVSERGVVLTLPEQDVNFLKAGCCIEKITLRHQWIINAHRGNLNCLHGALQIRFNIIISLISILFVSVNLS